MILQGPVPDCNSSYDDKILYSDIGIGEYLYKCNLNYYQFKYPESCHYDSIQAKGSLIPKPMFFKDICKADILI